MIDASFFTCSKTTSSFSRPPGSARKVLARQASGRSTKHPKIASGFSQLGNVERLFGDQPVARATWRLKRITHKRTHTEHRHTFTPSTVLPAVDLAEVTTLPVVVVTVLTAFPAVLATELAVFPAAVVTPVYVFDTVDST